jgi:hypothetical protein
MSVLIEAAQAGIHPWVRERTTLEGRRKALNEELTFWLTTAAQDQDFAEQFRRNAPDRGLPASAYLHRWLPLESNGHVLVGPRYLGMDPDLPFVGVAGSDRPLQTSDTAALQELARSEFGKFDPGFVLIETADPVDTRPGASAESVG